ncbi:hypothetical protein [Stenotrophomonas sp. GZD-301]|uniref:hypothetical protein n=1 Tax=Stenotrophomonas sp. GZD-301 TaxID=3404814 RepID=UPI003BB7374F
MIEPLKEQEAKIFRERLSNPMERIEFFPEPNAYCGWIGEMAGFIDSKGGSLAFAVERYEEDLEFFTADKREEYAMMFLTQFAPHELVFFGMDWIISISSYPECEYSPNLEYSIRLYGAASIMGANGTESIDPVP